MISMLLIPFIACLGLVFIHVYFGSLVLKRGVIFIDLALAQWAAMGYLVAYWLGFEHPVTAFCLAFTCTLIAGVILSLIKSLYHHIHYLEAVIGVLYISATTFSVCLISATGLEGHHLDDMLSGHLLFIQPIELACMIGLYAAVSICLALCHSFLFRSESKLWDFMFYVLFGIVVTSSVKLVGVLLVFSYLVIPLLSVVLFTHSFKTQLFWGWGLGICSSIGGLFISGILDIPPSYSIILVLCAVWVLALTIRAVSRASKSPLPTSKL